MKGVRQQHRRRGGAGAEIDALRARYPAATAGRAPAREEHADRAAALHAATGDPLALSDPAAAARLYGVDSAPRPAVRLRALALAIYGDPVANVARFARVLMRRRGLSAKAAAEAAVVIVAEPSRNTMIGVHAPASFDVAAESVRKAIPDQQQPDHAVGDTGAVLLVRPGDGRRVRDPVTMAVLGPTPARVPDTLYWRRRAACGDVIVLGIEKNPTI